MDIYMSTDDVKNITEGDFNKLKLHISNNPNSRIKIKTCSVNEIFKQEFKVIGILFSITPIGSLLCLATQKSPLAIVFGIIAGLSFFAAIIYSAPIFSHDIPAYKQAIKEKQQIFNYLFQDINNSNYQEFILKSKSI